MARLLDSNILIYAAQPEHAFLDEWLEAPATMLSAISITEVLGYEGITSDDEELFEVYEDRQAWRARFSRERSLLR